MHEASYRGYKETVELLLAHGADPNIQDKVRSFLSLHAYASGSSCYYYCCLGADVVFVLSLFICLPLLFIDPYLQPFHLPCSSINQFSFSCRKEEQLSIWPRPKRSKPSYKQQQPGKLEKQRLQQRQPRSQRKLSQSNGRGKQTRMKLMRRTELRTTSAQTS